MTISNALKTMPVETLAYHIVVGVNGSWLYNALHKYIDNPAVAQSIIDEYERDYGQELWQEIVDSIEDR